MVQSAEEFKGRGAEKGTMVERMASVRPKTSIDKNDWRRKGLENKSGNGRRWVKTGPHLWRQ